MLNPSRHPGERQSVVLRSVQGLSTCVSALAALFIVPWFHNLTSAAVGRIAIASYGDSGGAFVQTVYFIVLFPTVFFLLRAVLATLILMGKTWLAARFL